MKRRIRRLTHRLPAQAEPQAGEEMDASDSSQLFSDQNLDRLAADMELALRDLPVWKNLVKRVGLPAARKILRRNYLIRFLTNGSPRN